MILFRIFRIQEKLISGMVKELFEWLLLVLCKASSVISMLLDFMYILHGTLIAGMVSELLKFATSFHVFSTSGIEWCCGSRAS